MRRHYCKRCSKALAACICQWLHPQCNSIPILILQHTDETSKALGTAKLVELGLDKSIVHVATSYSQEQCFGLLRHYEASCPILLYHQRTKSGPFHLTIDFETVLFDFDPARPPFDSVILLDGTWRNAREILLTNQWLQNLPSIKLKNTPASRYRIRKSSQSGGLSTVEAVAKLLSVIEPGFNEQALLEPFEKMVEYQISRMGEHVYRNNYSN